MQLKGTTTRTTIGGVMAEIVVDNGGNQVVSALTRGSVESLGLQEGREVVAIIKSAEVIIGKG